MKPDKRTMKLAEMAYFLVKTSPETPRLLKKLEKICLQNIEEFAEAQGFTKNDDDRAYEYFLHNCKLYINEMKNMQNPELTFEEFDQCHEFKELHWNKIQHYLDEYALKNDIAKYLKK